VPHPPDATAAEAPERHATARGSASPVLFVSSNGTGMGHLARLIAMARRHSPAVHPQFLSLSRAVPVVASEGFAWDYAPSRGDLGMGPRRWNRVFGRRLAAVLERERPAAVVYDGTYPYDGLLWGLQAVPGTRTVWSRRGMWRPGGPARQLARSTFFDLIVEPGELAAAADRGATAGRHDALTVGPVTLLDADELLPREEAGRALGIDPHRPTVLLSLGAGNLGDQSTDLGLFVARLLAEPDLQILLVQALIADELAEFDRVHARSVFPISRYLRAVDFAVAAAGYNSFHELVGFGVPTVFVPTASTLLDDQVARARWAAEAGAALCVAEVNAATVDAAVSQLCDTAVRAGLAAACRRVARPNGAAAAMAAVEELLGVSGRAALR
jgi:UDP:flavonoid glycosyltransferase YjiC (YdhE family)